MFGEMVRVYRRQLGMTQEELARQVGVSVTSIARAESGRTTAPRPSTVRLLAEAFGLSGVVREHFCLAAASHPTDRPTSASGVVSPIPARLPADLPTFVGRRRELARSGAAAAAPVIAPVTGSGEIERPAWPCAGPIGTPTGSATAGCTPPCGSRAAEPVAPALHHRH